jgi:hypothetical protein
MVGPSADLTTEWEGGSLGELVASLQAAALPVRIEVIAPGTTDSNAGEVHLLAGGLADAFAGSLRRDDAMAALQRLEGARFIVEARLPDPESGSLSTPGPHEGSLKARPVASLMRYCEEYVLTCRLEVWRGQDRAVISYRRGEIVSTMVGGGDGSERLPEVMGWTDGSYEIVLPAPVLPPAPSRKPGARSVEPFGKSERKRHSTLPMAPSEGQAESSTGNPAAPASTPARAAAASPAPARSVAPAQASPAAPAGGTASPSATARSSGAGQAAASAPPPTATAASAATGRGQVTTQRLAGRQPPPQQAAAPSAPPARPAAAPPPQPAAPSTPRSTTTLGTPAQAAAATAKPAGRAPTPAMGTAAGRPPAEPLPAEATERGTPPVPAVPLIPARPGAQPTPPIPVSPTPPPFQLGQPGRPAKQPPASNDLKPASGTIEAKSGHANHLPPTAPPVEIADQPKPPSDQAEAVAHPAPSSRTAARQSRSQRKVAGEQPVKVYVLIGLAIGLGVVVAYWAYWYLPFFHH